MRLLRIRLKDFRGVEESEVRLDAPGVTVVVGPNEVGKSSLAEGLRLVRQYKSASSHRDVKAVQPTHRDVGPEVEIEVETGPYHFVYTKRWLRKHRTELTVLAPRRQQLSGDEAHDRVEAMFAETLDATLWDALQQVQGDSLHQPALGRATPLQAALSGRAGADDGSVHAALVDRAAAERALYLTATGKPTKELADAEQRRADAEHELSQAREAMARVESDLEAHARTVSRLADLQPRVAERAEVLAQVEQRHQTVVGLRRELERAEAAVREAELVAADARRRVEERQVLVAEVAERQRSLTSLDVEHEQVAARLAETETLLAPAVERRETARQAHGDATAALAAARRQVEQARAGAELASLRDRVQRAQKAADELRSAHEAQERNGLDAAALRRVEQAQLDVDSALAAARAGAARIVVEPLGDAVVHLDGRPVVRVVEHEVIAETEVDVPDVVRVRVLPDRSADEQAERVGRVRDVLAALLAAHDVPDLVAAREKAAEHADLVRAAEAAAATRDLVLAGESLDRLTARLTVLEERAEAAPAEPLEVLEDALDAADRVLRETERERDDAGADHDRLSDQVGALRADHARAAARREAAHAELDRLRTRLEADRAQQLDEALQATADESAHAGDAARAEVARLRDALDDLGAELLEVELENARGAVENAGREIAALEAERVRLESVLDDRGRDGLQDRLDQALAAVHDAERTHESVRARAAAADLLHEVLHRHQHETRARYVDPFRREVETLGRPVFGPDFAVEIADDLSVESRTLDGVTVPFAGLSGGAREQLALLTRLATARLVDPADGAPVVLDDSLGFSDPDRRRRLATVLALAGRQAQVVVLTCDPDRFAHLGQARFVALD
ncbi:AAA family ATPase [Aeromicrobium massiliense]|uniref:AAA family ATPase n=1 Tax=Aeromicrobium massiliense TaxID=1464554 RepID=UPI0005786E6D|nr:AAA family ATPase [Aeromicrobium massiliense]